MALAKQRQERAALCGVWCRSAQRTRHGTNKWSEFPGPIPAVVDHKGLKQGHWTPSCCCFCWHQLGWVTTGVQFPVGRKCHKH